MRSSKKPLQIHNDEPTGRIKVIYEDGNQTSSEPATFSDEEFLCRSNHCGEDPGDCVKFVIFILTLSLLFQHCKSVPCSMKIMQAMVDKEKVVVFMKGVPEAPQCGFSNAVCIG